MTDEGIPQLGRGTIPIKGPDVPGAYPQIVVHYSFAVVVHFVFRGEFQALRPTQIECPGDWTGQRYTHRFTASGLL